MLGSPVESRDRGFDFGEVLRSNSIAFGLIGLGVAWLIAGKMGLLDGVISSRKDVRSGKQAGGRAERIVGHTGEPAIDNVAGERDEGWVHQATEAVGGAFRSIRESGSAALERTEEYIPDPGRVGEQAKRAGSEVAGIFERNPLLLGVVGLVVGGVAAALAPATRREQELVGEARDELWRTVEEFGHQAAESVRGAAANCLTHPAAEH